MAWAEERDADAARADGVEELVRGAGEEEDEGSVRGFLEGFEEGVSGFCHHAVGVGDDAELHVAAGGELEPAFGVAHLVDLDAAEFGFRFDDDGSVVAETIEVGEVFPVVDEGGDGDGEVAEVVGVGA